MSQVVVMKTTSNSLIDDYSRLILSTDYQQYLPKDKKTIIELNLFCSFCLPACSTELWKLETVLKTMRVDGFEGLYPWNTKQL